MKQVSASATNAEVRAEVQQLVSRLADGDRSAIDPAVDALSPILRRYVTRLLRNPVDADDAIQRILMKLFDQVGDFDPGRDALGWVLTIASFECRTLLRTVERRRERTGELAAYDIATEGETPEDVVVRHDLDAALREVLGTLPERDVETILAAMADQRGGATFRKRLQRALDRLRVAWRGKHGTE